jgi:hypothetical protein
VFSIPFTYSVPVRIGLALNKVGTTISLTSLTDLVLLFVVWLCVNLRPVREFCVFAAVVIITDWFMLHTFFLTVGRPSLPTAQSQCRSMRNGCRSLMPCSRADSVDRCAEVGTGGRVGSAEAVGAIANGGEDGGGRRWNARCRVSVAQGIESSFG